MQWRGRRTSANIEDRRATTGSRRGAASLGGIAGFGVVAVVVIGYFLGVDLTPLLTGGGFDLGSGTLAEMTSEDVAAGEFVSVVLADTEAVWTDIFKAQVRGGYDPVTLVLYRGVTASPCGNASGATGPFYCPADKKVYLDTNFFTTMERQLGAGGDFAMAYVVAHEVAHHVQDELGILGQANDLRGRVSESASNAISVRIELQADCLSGIWARQMEKTYGVIEPGDFDEALNAAKQIGDDTLARNAGQRPMPHTFTHGTAEQRSRWFSTGLRSGEMQSCDTFAAKKL